MPTKEELKKRVNDAIESGSQEITEIGETILRNPELGYKEAKTAALVEDRFRAMGLTYQKGLALTGLAARLSGKSRKINVALLGELDSIRIPVHPFADPLTGAAHGCGHNAQIAGMLGAGMGLIHSGAMKELDGDVSLMAVPAEELVELEYRNKLREEGKIAFLTGKQEFIRLGVFDGIDMALMFHLDLAEPPRKVGVGVTMNGCVAKFIRYKGKESHAGGAPHMGVNALNAALLGLMGIHAQRETFKDEDSIRVHPILTKGGDLVNVVPGDVRIETFVRGRTVEAFQDAHRKVNRALKAGAMAVGATVEIRNLPGYLPVLNYEGLDRLFAANMGSLLGPDSVCSTPHLTGSSDMGDLSHLMPGLHAMIKAGTAQVHTESFCIEDTRLAYIETAKGLAMTVIDLLWDGAREGLAVKSSYRPKFTKDQFLKFWESLCQEN